MLLQIHEPGETPIPHKKEAVEAIGIDLGTTNSVIAISKDKKTSLLRGLCGESLIPSLVAYLDDRVVVGNEAFSFLESTPERVVKSIKRFMGEREGSQSSLHLQHFNLENRGGEEKFLKDGLIRFRIGNRLLDPILVSADILRALKKEAENLLDHPISKAVITVPAYFSEAARRATRQAAKLAGIDVLRLLSEPTAAAIAYGLDQKKEGVYAVYDLGGGTFDISVLRLEEGVFRVLGTSGDMLLGGDDFDDVIAAAFLDEMNLPLHALSPAEAKKLSFAARHLKEELSTKEAASFTFLVKGVLQTFTYSKKSFEEKTAPILGRTLSFFHEALEEAGVDPKDLDGIILVGGATRMPCVREMLDKVYHTSLFDTLDPDAVVAMGAALQAEALTKGSDHLLMDVLPLSLGIETMGGIVEKIIPRNTPLPAAVRQEFTTHANNQTGMSIHVVQGEREMAADCRSLQRFSLKGIPPMVAGAARVEITYLVDADGLLTVSAEEKTTGVMQHVEVFPTYGLNEEDMIRLIKEGYAHAEDDMERRLLEEARIDLERILKAIKTALEEDGALLDQHQKRALEALLEEGTRKIHQEAREALVLLTEQIIQKSNDFAALRMNFHMGNALRGKKLDD